MNHLCRLDKAARRRAIVVVLFVASLIGCQRASPVDGKATIPAAKVAHVAQEDELNTIQLSPEAEERLGIEVAPVQIRSIERKRTVGGEVSLPPGKSIIVSAPLAGMLRAPTENAVPKIGSQVRADQPIFTLVPLLSPERSVLTPAERVSLAQIKSTIAQSQIDAEGQVQQAEVQVEAAQIALDRAQRLLREQAGTARAVDDAKAQLELATKTLKAARTRKELVDNIRLDEEEPGKVQPIEIASPHEGIVRSLQVAPGEVVASGAPLFEIMDASTIWIKVPVYVGDLDDIVEEGEARVSSLAEAVGAETLSAMPIAAPPTAIPLASAVDLYYRLDNTTGELRPGQRVAVQLPLKGEREERVFPWSAVIHDINGGTWVYERTSPQTYRRRRVQVRYVVDGLAVIKDGPPIGSELVIAGAMELFGTEFGFAK